MARQHPPSISSNSFNCPHCGTLAHQTWYDLFVQRIEDGGLPDISDKKTIAQVDENLPSEIKARLLERFRKLCDGEIFVQKQSKAYADDRLENTWASRCYACDKLSIWLHGKLIYPVIRHGDAPNEDLSEEIIRDYDEARAVLDVSPRSAAALLRLCIQKICRELGCKGSNINKDIADLVARGLDVRIQQALDVVRVVGNQAVHPGQLDLTDDRKTATQLFRLVNLISEKMFSEPRHVQSMFDALPEEARAQITRRGSRS